MWFESLDNAFPTNIKVLHFDILKKYINFYRFSMKAANVDK